MSRNLKIFKFLQPALGRTPHYRRGLSGCSLYQTVRRAGLRSGFGNPRQEAAHVGGAKHVGEKYSRWILDLNAKPVLPNAAAAEVRH
jgi:hypothetical protein